MNCKNCGAILTSVTNGYKCEYCGDFFPLTYSNVGNDVELLFANNEVAMAIERLPVSKLADMYHPYRFIEEN